jgi:hypothetical protein
MLSNIIGVIFAVFGSVMVIAVEVYSIYYSIKMMKYGVEAATEVIKVTPAKETKDGWEGTKIYIRLMNAEGKYEEVVYSTYLKNFSREKINVKYLPENLNFIVANEPDIKEKIKYDEGDIIMGIFMILMAGVLLFICVPLLFQ